jgi:signal peptidase I
MKKKIKDTIVENIKTLLFALLVAIFIRSLLYQPFYIPSSSMEPTLLIGDRIFVSKFKYGYSKHSFPFSPPFYNERIFQNNPERGDLVVFKTPADNRTDYIKRLIGLPGDTIQFINGDLYINNNQISKSIISKSDVIYNADTPFINSLYKKCPNSELLTDGEKVGLPDGQMGNSEVGHLNIGAGRIVDQDLVKINNACKDESISFNKSLNESFEYVNQNKSSLHLIGLVSDGGIHSHQNHLY